MTEKIGENHHGKEEIFVRRTTGAGRVSGTGVAWGRSGLGVAVIPAQAGIHFANLRKPAVYRLDSRLRGNDWRFERDVVSNNPTTGCPKGMENSNETCQLWSSSSQLGVVNSLGRNQRQHLLRLDLTTQPHAPEPNSGFCNTVRIPPTTMIEPRRVLA
jgi:hypothetical protein